MSQFDIPHTSKDMTQLAIYSTSDIEKELSRPVNIPLALKQYESIHNINMDELCRNYHTKIPFTAVLKFANIDTSDPKTRFFYSVTSIHLLEVNKDILSWLGYSGIYREQKRNFVDLLKRNNIKFQKKILPESKFKEYNVCLMGSDFQRAIQKSNTKKCLELQDLFSQIKEVSVLYERYELYFEKHKQLRMNDEILNVVHSLREDSHNMNKLFTKECERAEEARQRAEEERQRADEERQRADEERQRAEEERQRAEENRIRQEEAEALAAREREEAEKYRIRQAEAEALAAKEREEAQKARDLLQRHHKDTKEMNKEILSGVNKLVTIAQHSTASIKRTREEMQEKVVPCTMPKLPCLEKENIVGLYRIKSREMVKKVLMRTIRMKMFKDENAPYFDNIIAGWYTIRVQRRNFRATEAKLFSYVDSNLNVEQIARFEIGHAINAINLMKDKLHHICPEDYTWDARGNTLVMLRRRTQECHTVQVGTPNQHDHQVVTIMGEDANKYMLRLFTDCIFQTPATGLVEKMDEDVQKLSM